MVIFCLLRELGCYRVEEPADLILQLGSVERGVMLVLVERPGDVLFRSYERLRHLSESIGSGADHRESTAMELKTDMMRNPEGGLQFLKNTEKLVTSARCVAEEVQKGIGI